MMKWLRVVGKRAGGSLANDPANVLIINGRVAVCTFMPGKVGEVWATFRSQLEGEFAIEELSDAE